MGHLTIENNTLGKKSDTLDSFGGKHYLSDSQLKNSNEYRIVKRRKLKSRLRTKVNI